MRRPTHRRELTDDERRFLEAGLRSRDAFVLRRCQIVLANARGEPVRLVEQAVANDDPDPKALACYGLLVRWWAGGASAPPHEEAWLRFVDGRPVSAATTRFLDWACGKLATDPPR